MTRSPRNVHSTVRLDALLTLPLDRFRHAIGQLSDDELTGLQHRLVARRVGARFARGGGHGFARHSAANELALLARREHAIERERETRRHAPPPGAMVAQLSLVAELDEAA